MTACTMYERIGRWIDAHARHLTQQEMERHVDMVWILSALMREKLTCEEILDAVDLLSDVALGRRPDLAVDVPKEERIRIL